MTDRRIKMIGALVGDIVREPSATVKYGLLFEALARQFDVLCVHDAALKGVDRLVNALRVIHPDRERWRQRFYQNAVAFKTRSHRVARFLESRAQSPDVILQVGVLFDAALEKCQIPNVIYTDYTMRLSADKPSAGRSPFTGAELEEWLSLETEAYARAAHICTRSQLVRRSVITDYRIAENRVTTVGGGVNFGALPSLPPRRHSDAPTALFIGKDFYRKGGDLVLHAFARVRKHLPHVHLLMVTNGPVPDNLPDEGVTFIEPTWDRRAIQSCYERADVFVLPSRLETWGDVLLEAMAYGLPCIGVRGDAMEEIITHESTGLLVSGNDDDQLTHALIRLLGERDTREHWGQNARQRVETNFTWDRVAARISSTIHEIIN